MIYRFAFLISYCAAYIVVFYFIDGIDGGDGIDGIDGIDHQKILRKGMDFIFVYD